MQGALTLTITRDPEEVSAAQRLRHEVFVCELGGAASLPDGVEGDLFDRTCDHLILRDEACPEIGVVATARMSPGTRYTGREFDVSRLIASGQNIAEVGRTCLHSQYRGGLAGLILFKGMLDHMQRTGIDILVGTASFQGADQTVHGPALRALRSLALAPSDLRPIAYGPHAIATDGASKRSDMRNVPALIKSYLRAGAWVGDGAWVDEDFNTVDVCIVMDMNRLRLPAGVRGGRIESDMTTDA